MKYTVYKTTNLTNGKIYVGVHKTTEPGDSYLGSGTLIQAAVKKHGRQAFQKEVLFVFDNPEDMEAKEAEIVDEAFVDRNDTYNLVPGGYQGNSFYQALRKMTPEFRKERSQKAVAARLLRLEQDLDWREQFRDRCVKQLQEHFPNINDVRCDWTGRKHSEFAKQKMRGPRPASAGVKNSQHGTAWICHEEHPPRKIQKSDLESFLKEGWKRGRKIR